MKYTLVCTALHLNNVALGLDDLHDLRNILLAGIVVGSLHHHTDKRLGAGLTDKDTAGVTQCLSYSPDCLLHRRVVLRSLLIGHTDIFQHLRVNLQGLSQLAHGNLLGQHYFHHLQAGQDTITSAGVLAEDNMTTLLTADTAAVLSHILIDVLVTHCSLA